MCTRILSILTVFIFSCSFSHAAEGLSVSVVVEGTVNTSEGHIYDEGDFLSARFVVKCTNVGAVEHVLISDCLMQDWQYEEVDAIYGLPILVPAMVAEFEIEAGVVGVDNATGTEYYSECNTYLEGQLKQRAYFDFWQ